MSLNRLIYSGKNQKINIIESKYLIINHHKNIFSIIVIYKLKIELKIFII